jgi:large subunit ribosomal protein LP0
VVQIIVCEIKDLPADMVHRIRKDLRTINSEVVCGKTTVMNKAITTYIKAGDFPSFHTIEGLTALNDKICNLQCLLIFTNEEVGKVTDITSKFIVEKQARIGSISPIEVIIPAGPTGMDSSQIEYFQALKIPTKVIKNQLEIVTATKILTVGAKITLSEINLMKKFNIKPYKHFVIITQIYMSGKLYDSGILKITEAYMKTVTERCIRNVAAFSLATGVTNRASAPHAIMNCFKTILGLSMNSKVDIPQTKLMSTAAPAAEPVKAAAPKKAEKVKEPEPEPEEDAGGFGDLFG